MTVEFPRLHRSVPLERLQLCRHGLLRAHFQDNLLADYLGAEDEVSAWANSFHIELEARDRGDWP